MEKLKIQEICEKIKSDVELVKSLSVNFKETNGEAYIEFQCNRYTRNGANDITSKQYDYIQYLCDFKSKSNLLKLNKWQASAIISAVKNYGIEKQYTYVIA